MSNVPGLVRRSLTPGLAIAALAAVALAPGVASTKTLEIIDSTGAGSGQALAGSFGVAVDGLANVYVTGSVSNNAFRISPAGVISEIIDATGDGAGNGLDQPRGITVDGSDNVYITGRISDNAFKVDSGGVVTELIDSSGDGVNPLLSTRDIAVDGNGNVYVTGGVSNNAFRITPGGLISQIIDASGDGLGNPLDTPVGVTVDAAGYVYVTGSLSNNVFEIDPNGLISQIMDASGDGGGNPLEEPLDVAVDGLGNVYVGGAGSDNVFEIDPGGVITEIIDGSGDGLGALLGGSSGVAVDGSGNVYVTGNLSNNAFQISPDGAILEIIDSSGDGKGNPLGDPVGVAVDAAGFAYLAGSGSNNAFKFTGAPLTKRDQKCVGELNKALRKVAKQQGRHTMRCLRQAAAIEDCVSDSGTFGKDRVAREAQKARQKASRKCLVQPRFGATDPNTVIEAALSKELTLIHQIFGSDLDAVIVSSDVDVTQFRCQQAVARQLWKCQDRKLKGFNKCKKSGMKANRRTSPLRVPDPNDVPFDQPEHFEACMGFDPRGRLDKLCNLKLVERFNQRCASLNLGALFAGDCVGTPTLPTLATCLEALVECRACTALNEADALARDCDLFDDGLANASCP